jgi:cytochrome c
MRAVDSGVDNRDRGDGCSVEDLIEDEREWPGHGRFMRHVRTVTDRLVRADVITRHEQGDILDAAGRSSHGGSR